MPWASPYRDYSGARTILPDCGVRLEKVKRVDRPAMPEAPLRIARMFETGAGSLDLMGEDLCILCERAGQSVGETPALQCAFCLTNIHQTCAK